MRGIKWNLVLFLAIARTGSSSSTAIASNLRGGSGKLGEELDDDGNRGYGRDRRLLSFLDDISNLIQGLVDSLSTQNSDDSEESDDEPGGSPQYDGGSDTPAAPSPRAVPLEPQTLKDAGKLATIVGGDNASPDEAPYFAMMLSWSAQNEQWEYNGCGGTLVSNKHILTAGHCAEGRHVNQDAVYVHAYQPFSGNPGVSFHYSKVESYTVHPSFLDGPNDSDVAIVTMVNALDVSDFPPIQLASPDSIDLDDGDYVKVYGFGRKSYSDETQVSTLQAVSLPFIDRTSCMDFYGTKVLEDMFCAGYEDGGKDACGGDSGGPMVLSSGNGGEVQQVGLVSWGDGCAGATK